MYGKSNTITAIRNLCIRHSNNIKISWIPGHKGIAGNEVADGIARSAVKSLCLTFNSLEHHDLKKMIKITMQEKKLCDWRTYEHWYKNFNPTGVKIIYPIVTPYNKIKIFVRLRIGHTALTHGHLLTATPPESFVIPTLQ